MQLILLLDANNIVKKFLQLFILTNNTLIFNYLILFYYIMTYYITFNVLPVQLTPLTQNLSYWSK